MTLLQAVNKALAAQESREDLKRLESLRRQLEASQDPDFLRSWALNGLHGQMKRVRKHIATGAKQ